MPSTQTSVYRYYDKYAVLIYVGITSRGPARNAEHNVGKAWWPYVHHQEVDHFPTREQAATTEKALIRQFRPPFNTQHNPGHAEIREAYAAYLAQPPTFPPLVALYRSAGRQISLHRVGQGDARPHFHSATIADPLVAALNRNSYELKLGSIKSGRARLYRQDGVLLGNLKGEGSERVNHLFANLRCLRTKQPTFEVVGVSTIPRKSSKEGDGQG